MTLHPQWKRKLNRDKRRYCSTQLWEWKKQWGEKHGKWGLNLNKKLEISWLISISGQLDMHDNRISTFIRSRLNWKTSKIVPHINTIGQIYWIRRAGDTLSSEWSAPSTSRGGRGGEGMEERISLNHWWQGKVAQQLLGIVGLQHNGNCCTKLLQKAWPQETALWRVVQTAVHAVQEDDNGICLEAYIVSTTKGIEYTPQCWKHRHCDQHPWPSSQCREEATPVVNAAWFRNWGNKLFLTVISK